MNFETVQFKELNWRVYAERQDRCKGQYRDSRLRARSNFGKLLNRVDKESRSVVIEKRGTPRAILLSIRDYVRLAAPEPEVLRAIGAESARKGTASLSSGQIDRIIKAARAKKAAPKKQR